MHAKNKEAAKVTIAKIGNVRAIEIAKNCINEGMDNELISEITEISITEIEKMRKELKQSTLVLNRLLPCKEA